MYAWIIRQTSQINLNVVTHPTKKKPRTTQSQSHSEITSNNKRKKKNFIEAERREEQEMNEGKSY